MRVGRALIVIESPRNPNKGLELTHWSLGLFHEFPGSVCRGHMSMDLSRCEDFPGTSVGRDSLLLKTASWSPVFTTGFICARLKFWVVETQ